MLNAILLEVQQQGQIVAEITADPRDFSRGFDLTLYRNLEVVHESHRDLLVDAEEEMKKELSKIRRPN